jgi:hypothetical protein
MNKLDRLFKRKAWTSKIYPTDDLLCYINKLLEDVSCLNEYVIQRLSKFAEGELTDTSDGMTLAQRSEKCCSPNSTSLESFQLRYGNNIGHIKFKECSLRRGKSLESYCIRHGKQKGQEKFNLYWNNTNFSTSKFAFIRRLGEKEGNKQYRLRSNKVSEWASGVSWEDKESYQKMVTTRSQSIRDADYNHDTLSVEAFKTRFGSIEGPLRYDQYHLERRKHNPLCVEYHQLRGMSVSESRKRVKEIQVFRQRRASLITRGSIESSKLIFPLYKICRKLGIDKDDIFCGFGDRSEWWIVDDRNKIYFYDFCVRSLNIIVEFHGVAYHVKPDRSNFSKLRFKDEGKIQKMVTKDIKKRDLATKENILFEVWSDDKISEKIHEIGEAIKKTYEQNNIN